MIIIPIEYGRRQRQTRRVSFNPDQDFSFVIRTWPEAILAKLAFLIDLITVPVAILAILGVAVAVVIIVLNATCWRLGL